MCFGNAYCIHAAAALHSIIAHASAQRRYRICIFDETSEPLTGLNKRRLAYLAAGHPQVQLEFLPCDLQREAGGRLWSNDRYTLRPYFKLFVHRLLPAAGRVLCLDADIIAGGDVARLYAEDLHGQPLGAVRDGSVTLGTEHLKSVRLDPRKVRQAMQGGCYATLYEYYTAHLGLSESELASFFNSGVLLMDVPAITPLLEQGLPSVLTRSYCYYDQDMLNVLCRGRVQLLAIDYNCPPGGVELCLRRTGRMPLICHFLGAKASSTMSGPAHGQYWRHLAHTPYFHAALEQFINARVQRLADQAGRDFLNLQRRVEELERRAGVKPAQTP